MKDREILLGIIYHSLRQTEIRFYDGPEIDWAEIERRCAYLYAGAPCISAAFHARYMLESERDIESDRLCFKAVVGDQGTLWHIWLEMDGQIVDKEAFIKAYKRIYPVGQTAELFEQQYQSMKKIGAFEAF
jgi:hypothetical protein